MRAVVKSRPERGVDVASIPSPRIGPGQALIEVEATGICGSDLHAFEWVAEYGWLEPHLPCVLGHEVIGRVVATDTDANIVGQRVAVRPAITCGSCVQCQQGSSQHCSQRVRMGYEAPGGLASHMAAPLGNLYLLPDSLKRDTASLIEPLTVAVHALSLGHMRPAATVAVIGVGAIGLLGIQVLRALGAADVLLIGTESDELGGGLALGLELGATDVAVAGSSALERYRDGCELVLVAAGAEAAVRTAIELGERQAQVISVGLGIGTMEIDMDLAVRRETRLVGSFGSMPNDWLNARALLASGQVDGEGIVSHHVDIESVPAAFELLANREARKMCVLPNG